MCRWAADYDDGAQSGVRVVRMSSGLEADKITLYAFCCCQKKGALFVDGQLKDSRAGGVDGQEKLEKKMDG